MPYEAPGEAFFTGFDTAHYVRKAKTGGYKTVPSGPMTKRPVTAQRARNIAKVEAKRCMQRLAEKKHLTTNTNAIPPTAGALGSAVVLSQGSSATTRTGNQIHLSLLSVEGLLSLPAATASDEIRLIVFVDTEANGAAPAVTDILEGALLGNPYNRDKVPSRFRILTDKRIAVNQQAATVATRIVPVHFTKKLDTVVYYQSNAGTISDVLKNNLGWLLISAGATATANLNFQICYTDL